MKLRDSVTNFRETGLHLAVSSPVLRSLGLSTSPGSGAPSPERFLRFYLLAPGRTFIGQLSSGTIKSHFLEFNHMNNPHSPFIIEHSPSPPSPPLWSRGHLTTLEGLPQGVLVLRVLTGCKEHGW